MDECKLPAHKSDNHWLDCVVRAAAAASMQGALRIGATVRPHGDRKRLKLSALRRSKR